MCNIVDRLKKFQQAYFIADNQIDKSGVRSACWLHSIRPLRTASSTSSGRQVSDQWVSTMIDERSVGWRKVPIDIPKSSFQARFRDQTVALLYGLPVKYALQSNS